MYETVNLRNFTVRDFRKFTVSFFFSVFRSFRPFFSLFSCAKEATNGNRWAPFSVVLQGDNGEQNNSVAQKCDSKHKSSVTRLPDKKAPETSFLVFGFSSKVKWSKNLVSPCTVPPT